MSEQTVVAESSSVDVFNGESPTFDEYSRYRQSGELPERFKPAEEAEAAPADAPEETVESEDEESESEPESEPEETQEPPKGSGAEKRIKQLLAEKKELQRKLEAAAKQDVKPAPSPAQPQYTRPKPTSEDKNQDGSAKYATYEDFVEELADWKAEQRWVAAQREQAAQAQARELQSKVDEARSRYENFDEVMQPVAAAIVGDQQVSPVVKSMLNDSEFLPDLLFTIGSDQKDLDAFVKMAKENPGKAIRYIAVTENLIREELEKEPEGEKTPEVKKTAAPKPPAPVSGGNSRAFDVSDESLSAEEWARKRNAQIQKRGKA